MGKTQLQAPSQCSDFKLKHLLPPERLAQFAAGIQQEREWGCPGEMGSRRQTPEPRPARLCSAATECNHMENKARCRTRASDTLPRCMALLQDQKVHPCAATAAASLVPAAPCPAQSCAHTGKASGPEGTGMG